MATSPLRSKLSYHARSISSKLSYHARSISLPSTSDPLTSQLSVHLDRLKASEANASCSLSSMSNRLSGLPDLYDFIGDLLLLPQTQQSFRQNQRSADETLDRYLGLLDVCTIAKDVLSQAKEEVQDLQSSLRRKRDANDADAYLTSRKKSKKAILKSLKNFKPTKNQQKSLPTYDHEAAATFSLLKETEEFTLAVLVSLLSSIAGRTGSKSLFSMLKPSGRHEETEANEIDKVDAALHSLTIQTHKAFDKSTIVEDLQKQLGKIESNIQVIEEELDCFFRSLIKTRVSLLNIHNH